MSIPKKPDSPKGLQRTSGTKKHSGNSGEYRLAAEEDSSGTSTDTLSNHACSQGKRKK